MKWTEFFCCCCWPLYSLTLQNAVCFNPTGLPHWSKLEFKFSRWGRSSIITEQCWIHHSSSHLHSANGFEMFAANILYFHVLDVSHSQFIKALNLDGKKKKTLDTAIFRAVSHWRSSAVIIICGAADHRVCHSSRSLPEVFTQSDTVA